MTITAPKQAVAYAPQQGEKPSGDGHTLNPSGDTVHIVTWRLLDYQGQELTYGGLQRWLLALLDSLQAMGHRAVVHQRASTPFSHEWRPGVTIRGHRSSPRALATPAFNRKVHRCIPAHAPVVYMAEDVAFPICRARSVVIQHGIWWDGELGPAKLRLAEFFAHRAVRRSAATICVDTNFINWYRARWPRCEGSAKLHYVPNFIDPDQWGPQPRLPAARATRDRLTVCFPRRSEPRRGIHLMAEVAPRLLERFDHLDFRFVVGSGYHTEALRTSLAASGADPKRWPIEVLAFDAMRQAYEQSEIVVIPTVCGEGTSLSAIEAMYFGCAVVSTWVGGLPNLVLDGHNGLLIAPQAFALEDAIARLVTDGSLRERLGTTAMATILPRHGVETWRQRTTEVLSRSLALVTQTTNPGAP